MAVEAQPRVLMMCGLSEEDADGVVQETLTPVVWTAQQVGWLGAAARRAGRTVSVHVEVDSGMTRQGARPGAELEQVLQAIRETHGVQLDGVMTQFASAEAAGSRQTAEQKARFEEALAEVVAVGMSPAWISAGNTSGVDVTDGAEDLTSWVSRLARGMGARSMVRPGLGLYGYRLAVEAEGEVQAESRLGDQLEPVMTWKTKVIGLEEVSAGAAVGYNGIFVAERPMRLALVPAGYADGLRRELSSTNTREGGWVMLRGQRAPIVGRISMNLTTVDVSGIDGVLVGDEAVLLGEGVSAEDHARLAGTIVYEILCGVRAVERHKPRS